MRRRSRIRRSIILVLAVCLVAYLAWLVCFSRAFGVRDIQVDGISLVTADDVVAASGVTIGEPLVQVSQSKINTNLTGNMLEIASVKVTKHLSGTLELHVTERTAIYQVAVGDQFGLVSADGTVFHLGAMAPSLLTCQVSVGDSQLLAGVATVVLALPNPLVPHVSYVTASSQDSISLQLDGDRQVIWGSAEQSDLKAQVLSKLLSVQGHVYDVSAPASPSVK